MAPKELDRALAEPLADEGEGPNGEIPLVFRVLGEDPLYGGEGQTELFCGLVEWGMANGVREIVAVYDVRIAKLHPRIGCRPKWRTKGQRMGNTITMVGAFDLDEAVLAELRARAGITAPVLVTATADAA